MYNLVKNNSCQSLIELYSIIIMPVKIPPKPKESKVKEVLPPPEPEPMETKQKLVKKVEITINAYENISGFYSMSDIKTQYNFKDKVIGETDPKPITSDVRFDENYTFSLECDINSTEEVNLLISNPVFFTVIQTYGASDPEIYTQQEFFGADNMKSYESAISLYEAFTGDESERQVYVDPKKLKKGKKDKKKKGISAKTSKTSKSSKSSKGSKKSKKNKKSKADKEIKEKQPDYPPVTFGMCTLDLFPIFAGQTAFSESLVIKPLILYSDDRMITYKRVPKIVVSVVSEDLLEVIGHDSVVVYITIESIYNLPDVMDDEDMDFEVCVPLPVYSGILPIVFKNPRLTQEKQEDSMKLWPGIPKLGCDANATKYRLKASTITIKNRANSDIETAMNEGRTRIEFNYLTRIVISRKDFEALIDHLAKYNKIMVEVYMKEKVDQTKVKILKQKPSKSSKSSKGSLKKEGKSSKSSKASNVATFDDNVEFLHLMSIVNLSYLLKPCISNARVASPLTTYHFFEAKQFAGINDSYFRPIPKLDTNVSPTLDKPDKKARKADKRKKGKNKKKGKDQDEDNDLKYLLPKEVQAKEIEPSMKVFSEDGKRSFIVVEIQVSDCIMPKREDQDIELELKHVLQREGKALQTEIILPCGVVRDYFRETITEITKDINEKFHDFYKDAPEEEIEPDMNELEPYSQQHCVQDNKYKSFNDYLEYEGFFEKYLSSLSTAASLFVDKNLQHIAPEAKQDHLIHVGYVYSMLVQEMHSALNRMVGTDLQPQPNRIANDLSDLLRYAKGALVRKQYALAEAYYLKRLCLEESNASLWFEYAVFLLELNQTDKAFRCLYEGLLKEPLNYKCLLLFGILLSDYNKEEHARICFEALKQNPKCPLEAYGVMYIFFEKYDDFTSMDTTMEYINKKMSVMVNLPDTFFDSEEYVWVKRPNIKTIFMRTAVYLLKMRVFNWVELAVTYELSKFYGEAHYLLAAVCYYKQQYEHALEHIEEAEYFCGTDYTFGGLTGLILMELGRPEEAKEELRSVMENYNRPDNLVLIYLGLSRTLNELNEPDEALKYVLKVCEISPSPYTWYQAGVFYFNSERYLEAEQCFSESNKLNSTLPETWGYLTLTNLKLEKIIEGEFCYRQAIKHNLEDDSIMNLIKTELMVINRKFNLSCLGF